jgi:TRAP transporter 4TM/12TM fusion protein
MPTKDQSSAVSAVGLKEAELDEASRRRLQELIEEEEGATNKLSGWLAGFITAVGVAVSLFHLYGAYDIVPAAVLRPAHVGCMMFLAFLLFPMLARWRGKIHIWDWIPALLSVAVTAYILWQGDEFGDRATAPTTVDYYVGVLLIVLLLEATRRSTGWIMPSVALVFLAYGLYGNKLPQPWTHRGYALEDMVAHLYMTLEGIFGTTVDVSSSLIILFTIFGAVLQHSGAGKFFIDFSFAAMGGKRNSAGRAVVLSSFLMGGPSGSGVATTVTIGTVAYPLLEKAGYEKNAAGGLLAAGGLGAIISPPVLGAAAFLIAEFLKISYLDVITMAAIPTLLYYFAILVMVELDAKKYGGGDERLVPAGNLWAIARDYWFHFGSLVSIIAFMLIGFSPVLSVFWATILAIAVSALRADTSIIPRWAAWPLLLSMSSVVLEYSGIKLPYQNEATSALVFGTLLVILLQAMLKPGLWAYSDRLLLAMKEGTTGVINVATTCAAAGIIVGVVTKTGLAQRFADIIIGYAGGSLLLTAVFTGLIVWVVGLAVPVTASYIMCAVIAAPALIKLGVPDYAAHMFIFYYAVLSEVSPPTALSPFAAAAITGGSPYQTTLQSWKYTMPAFLVPFVFVCDPQGIGLLMKIPKGGNWFDIIEITLETAAGIAILACAMQGYMRRANTPLDSGLQTLAGLCLVFPILIGAITRPLIGFDIEALTPGLSSIGVRMGYNVLIGLALCALAWTLQRGGRRLV